MAAISSLWERLVRRVVTGAAAGAVPGLDSAAAPAPGAPADRAPGAAAPIAADPATAAPAAAAPTAADPATAAPGAATLSLGWPIALDVPAVAWEIPEAGGEVVPLAEAVPPPVAPPAPETGEPAAEGSAERHLCLWCLGSGQVSTPAPCPACAGAGEEWCEGITLVCPTCHGTRRVNAPCPSCRGDGWVAAGGEAPVT